MKLAILKERRPGEARVAATPETVKKLKGLGLDILVESGAGARARVSDTDFETAGAVVTPDVGQMLGEADIVFSVRGPGEAEIAKMKKGAVLACMLAPYTEKDMIQRLAAQGVTAFAMEFIPRISRAQAMDVLSSQANLAGYKAVIDAAAQFGRAMPMMMTAAGTIAPARVFIMGVGVAGLQAIATARRLGAIVSATDVRPAAKEEIKSLGATFVGVEDEETAKQTGPYAGELSAAFRQKQAELMAATVAKNDIVICTALVMGRRAPVIVTAEMVAAMRPGSVIVDLAADAGGNCAATRPGELAVTENGVKVLGWHNWPGRIPVAASALYARNLLTFLTTFWDREAGAPRLPAEDDIVKGVLLTRDGAVVHPQFAPQQSAAA
ncbi:MAG: Re/Si-specific NAD(P)(+) transhydrogenase subunit alpha [Pseudomonadota bacterium]|nr:Re/Si-specific NAD(P)(+) transhydrogenase subunit alpha [Pseudomonadota bacterium]